ncbi:hypothetical protein [Bulleidia sp. HCP3S3_F2]|uniref:hypothetical protein n=1 Tax=unclassified Bulleidia TaxID=2704656 RepID=UPI003F888B96
MDLTAGNLDSFEGKNIGVLKDNILENMLNEWELKYGLHMQHVNISNTTEIKDKLSKHEIDCFVSVENPVGKNRIFHRLQVLERQKSISL